MASRQANPTAPANVTPSANENKYVDLVFEGGGVKGIAMVGALAILEEQGYKPQNLAGTSAGAIVAALLAAGYTAAEMREMIAGQDFRAFMDTDWVGRIPIAGASINMLTDQGIYKGDVFLNNMRRWLAAKGVYTFADLRYTPPPGFQDTGDERYRYKIQVVASDLTDRSFLVLPRDSYKLGIDPDDLEVALAVRMSMSIPIFFEPVRLENPKTGQVHTIVDGGVLSTYPIWLFDSEGVPDWPTFGLHLVASEPSEQPPASPAPPLSRMLSRMGNLEGLNFLASLYFTMKTAHDRQYIEESNFARTIAIPTLGVSFIDFNLSRDAADALYESGRRSATEFLSTWDFDGYIAECRNADQQLSRRQRLTHQLQEADERARQQVIATT